jgi:DNA-binding CsgD family transcriptional regulator
MRDHETANSSIAALPTASIAEAPTPFEDPPQPRSADCDLLRVLEAVVLAVRKGSFETNIRSGVLLDIIVDGVRCTLVVQHPSGRVNLSPRERQIALMVARGHTNQAIASALEISAWTVSTHLRRIFAKFSVSSRAEMVAQLAKLTTAEQRST